VVKAVTAGAVLLVNSAYLAAFADPSLFYFANVVLHVTLGIGIAVVAVRYLFVHRPAMTRLVRLAAAVLAFGAVAGFVLMISGATRPYRWILYTHIALSAAGVTLLAIGLFRAARRADAVRTRRLAPLYPAFVAALLVLAFTGRLENRRREQQRYRIENPMQVPLSMNEEGAGPQGPFFPSSATTTRGGLIPANFFMTSAAC
jgi:hypothetical protein